MDQDMDQAEESPEPGVWVAYYGDRSDIAIFDSEIAALRHAVGSSMYVTFWHFGQDWASATA